MISKTDCILLLTDLEKKGIDVKEKLNEAVNHPSISLDVLKFINNNRQMDLTAFYKHIRKSYNNKKSKLYINIVKEIEDVNDVLTTLASLNL